MREYSEYSDAQPKHGGAYTGWRPRERSRWHYLGILPFIALIAAMVLKVLS